MAHGIAHDVLHGTGECAAVAANFRPPVRAVYRDPVVAILEIDVLGDFIDYVGQVKW